jgi:cytosine/adenosine deaminase-related metal-dependent hydrolase
MPHFSSAVAPSVLVSVLVVALASAIAACSSEASSTPNVTPDGGDPDAETGDAAGPASCAITKKGGTGLVLQGTVLTPTGPIKGEVLVGGDGRITCVDASCSGAAGYGEASVLACPDGVISPGLINGHDHTDYNVAGPLKHAEQRWVHRHGWRTGAGGEPKLATPKSTNDDKAVAAAELRFIVGGATTINGSGGVEGLVRNAGSRVAAQLDGLKNSVFFDTFPLGDSNGKTLTTGCAYPSVRTAAAAFAGGHVYSPHIAEGINLEATNELACLKDSVVTDKTAIIHAVSFNAKDVDVVAKANAKVIWSARTNVDLYGNTAPVTMLKNAGVTIALGTDWLASGSMNMLRELSCIDSLNQKYFNKAFDDKTLWEMATKNGAIALNLQDDIGSLEPGKFADIAVFSGKTSKDYRAVLDAGVEDVLLVLRGGKAMFGSRDIIEALPGDCGDLDVCGVKKKACVDTPNVTLADITALADANYPLYFCKKDPPTDEPSCVPFRDTYPNGTSATDRDGDGIDDGADDCPDVFNPVRPTDGTTQADGDGDGKGDACDPKPLDPAN